MDNPPVLDPPTLDALRALNPDDGDAFLKEIIGIYLEDTPQRLADLDTGLASGDRPLLIRAAHSVKGSSANIGAMAVRAVAEVLEARSKGGESDLAPLIAQLKAEFATAETALRKLL